MSVACGGAPGSACHQGQVHHGSFIHDDHIHGQRIPGMMGKRRIRAESQKSVRSRLPLHAALISAGQSRLSRACGWLLPSGGRLARGGPRCDPQVHAIRPVPAAGEHLYDCRGFSGRAAGESRKTSMILFGPQPLPVNQTFSAASRRT